MELIKNISKEKLRGGFYTPAPIVDFILKWGFNSNEHYDILEPGCGDGVFLDRIKANQYQYNSLVAIELDQPEADKSRQIALSNSKVINGEFHKFCNKTKEKFDLIIGNPPYIRYQYFDKEQQYAASVIFNRAGLKYSKLTNAWVSFVVGSSLMLKETGKIGFVLPAEILQVSYAKTLRKYIAQFYNKINIVSFKKLVFKDIQQEVVVLLCEKDSSGEHLIEHIEVNDTSELIMLDVNKLKTPQKQIDFKSNKWTFYFLDQKEIDFIEEIKKNTTLHTFGQFADVEVGITTGSNPFFTVPLSIVQIYQLEDFVRSMVGRSVQVSSTIFTEDDWRKNRDSEARAHLLVFPARQELNGYQGAKDYIAWGEKQGIHKGYKCSIRDEWQIVPSLWISDALFIRRNNLYPKLLINEAQAYTTDTMHRVRINEGINKNAFVASYYNSVSLAFTEICGRSHGGGVLELMPNEVEDIVIPYNENNEDLLHEIDQRIRSKENIADILKFSNTKTLKMNYGFSNNDIHLANSIWRKLSGRRLSRGRKQDIANSDNASQRSELFAFCSNL